MCRPVLSLLLICFGSFFLFACESAPVCEPSAAPNTLTENQREAGWELLFDGKTTAGWRRYKGKSFPDKGWSVEEGNLHIVPAGGGGDIITTEQYGDFELYLEFKVAPKANSGIMYRVSEHEVAPWQTGAEYQILDDTGFGIEPGNAHSVGAMYDLYAPPALKKVKPAGAWNSVRVVMKGPLLEHWLNEEKVVNCDLSSEEWAQRREKSKFNIYSRFARNEKGYLALQDHGHEVWFRNIRIRRL